MSVPLDRLYNFLHDLCNHDDIVIYRFYPHGSKKIKDLTQLVDIIVSSPLPKSSIAYPIFLICHDQEPLKWDLYSQSPGCGINLRAVLAKHGSCYNKVLLLHSEKNSPELEKYQSKNFIGVYYWSHAIIARDWFRYAKHDPILAQSKQITKDFLIYNRAWSGTREYRLKFVECLIEHNLLSYCNIKFNPYDHETHYCNHKFSNPSLSIQNFNYEQIIPLNDHNSDASADYNTKDYITSAIEIVLETLFDDQRWHLTEKVLRPIATGQPFILAATPGSLRYLRSYGFKTFGQLINEGYDDIDNPKERLVAISTEMKRIASLDQESKTMLYTKLKEIADYNKQHFFSDKFFKQVINEYKTNLELGLNNFSPRRIL